MRKRIAPTCKNCYHSRGKQEGESRCAHPAHRLRGYLNPITGATGFVRERSGITKTRQLLNRSFGICEDYNNKGQCLRWRKRVSFLRAVAKKLWNQI